MTVTPFVFFYMAADLVYLPTTMVYKPLPYSDTHLFYPPVSADGRYSLLPADANTVEKITTCSDNCSVCKEISSLKAMKGDWCWNWLCELKDWKLANEKSGSDQQVEMMPNHSQDAVLRIRRKLAELQIEMVCETEYI